MWVANDNVKRWIFAEFDDAQMILIFLHKKQTTDGTSKMDRVIRRLFRLKTPQYGRKYTQRGGFSISKMLSLPGSSTILPSPSSTLSFSSTRLTLFPIYKQILFFLKNFLGSLTPLTSNSNGRKMPLVLFNNVAL